MSISVPNWEHPPIVYMSLIRPSTLHAKLLQQRSPWRFVDLISGALATRMCQLFALKHGHLQRTVHYREFLQRNDLGSKVSIWCQAREQGRDGHASLGAKVDGGTVDTVWTARATQTTGSSRGMMYIRMRP